MTQETQAEQRFAAIEAKQGQAAMLLAETRQEPLKEQVVLALRDLDEGLRWLRKEDRNKTDGPNALAATPPFRNAD